jgi:hypothetical protein
MREPRHEQDPRLQSFRVANTGYRISATPSYEPCESGPCKRGTKVCPTPQACSNPEQDVSWLMVVLRYCGLTRR